MKTPFIYKGTQEYISHTELNGERIIPSDSFEIDTNEYLLLEILKLKENIIFLKIIGIKGSDMGNIYFIPKQIFEEKTLVEIKESLKDYQD